MEGGKGRSNGPNCVSESCKSSRGAQMKPLEDLNSSMCTKLESRHMCFARTHISVCTSGQQPGRWSLVTTLRRICSFLPESPGNLPPQASTILSQHGTSPQSPVSWVLEWVPLAQPCFGTIPSLLEEAAGTHIWLHALLGIVSEPWEERSIKVFENGIIFVAVAPSSQRVGWDENGEREGVFKVNITGLGVSRIAYLNEKMGITKPSIKKVIYFVHCT